MTRVLLIGDSHGVGLMMPMRAQAPAGSELLVKTGPAIDYKTLPPDVTVVAGMGAPYFERRIKTLLSLYQPDVVFISLGGNDYQSTGTWRDRVAKAVPAVVNSIAASGAVPVWMDPPAFPFEDEASVRNMWLSEPVHVFPAGDALPYSSDHIHLTRAGYEELARRAWSWLAAEGLVDVPASLFPVPPASPATAPEPAASTAGTRTLAALGAVLVGYGLVRIFT